MRVEACDDNRLCKIRAAKGVSQKEGSEALQSAFATNLSSR
jgi:hypothetical protein